MAMIHNHNKWLWSVTVICDPGLWFMTMICDLWSVIDVICDCDLWPWTVIHDCDSYICEYHSRGSQSESWITVMNHSLSHRSQSCDINIDILNIYCQVREPWLPCCLFLATNPRKLFDQIQYSDIIGVNIPVNFKNNLCYPSHGCSGIWKKDLGSIIG